MSSLTPMATAALGAVAIPGPRSAGPGFSVATPVDDRESVYPWEPLVHRARRGDTEAFAALVDTFGPRVLGYLQRLTRHPQDAEDLTQETFLKAHRMLPSFASPRAFPAWIFTIARRTALNHFRAARPAEPVDPEYAASGPDPAQSASDRDRWRNLWARARHCLKPAQYEVLWLRYAEELSIGEIAEITRRSPLHVRVLLHRGRNTLLPVVRHLSSHPQPA